MIKKSKNNIKRCIDGSYEGRYFKELPNGKIFSLIIRGKTYHDVEMKLKAIVDKPKSKEEAAKKNIFSFVSMMWLKEQKNSLKESSLSKYKNYLSWYILPRFGNILMNNITKKTVESFCLELLRFGGNKKQGLSNRTVKDIFSIISQVAKYAKMNKIPVDAIGEFPKIKDELKPLRVFNIVERTRLFDYLYESRDMSDLGILLSLTTGIRLGELCALSWDDFSFSDQKLYIRHTLSRIADYSKRNKKTKIVVTEPKTKSSIRVIPLPVRLCRILSPIKKQGTYFLTGSRVRFVEPRAMQYRFKAVLKKCGVGDANFHALRHTFATGCVEAKLDIKSISEILGHSSVNITLNRYVHPSMEVKLYNMEKLFNQYK